MVTKVFWKKFKAPNGALVSKREVKHEVNYSIGLDRLLDCFDADAKTQMLYERIVALENKVNNLNNNPVDEKKEPKTFGFFPKKNDEVKENVETK